MPIAEVVSPRPSPRELLEMLQKSPLSPIPGTPEFLAGGFARPTPGQPLMYASFSNILASTDLSSVEEPLPQPPLGTGDHRTTPGGPRFHSNV